MPLSDLQRQEVARLKANDARLHEVDWFFNTGVGDAEVEALAEGLEGNTVCWCLDLAGNDGVTDASMGRLRRGL
eukprot:COSAG01_NODE_16254_length_1254_cov_2.108225_2_plen_74_part_00